MKPTPLRLSLCALASLLLFVARAGFAQSPAPRSTPTPVIPPPYEFPDSDRNTSGPDCPQDPTQCSGYKVADDVEEVWRGEHPVTPARPQAVVTTTPISLTTYGDVQFNVATDAIVQLPSATGSGNRYRFKDLTNNRVVLNAVAPQLIDGQASVTMAGTNTGLSLVDTFCTGGVPCWAIEMGGGAGGASGACQQDVSLVSGVGAFVSSCIVPQSYCSCRDRTNNGNTCYTSEPAVGTVGLVGNANDTVQAICTASLIQPLPNVASCQGNVSLASGTGQGTFTASCVSPASYCSCRDTTSPSSACYVGNPVSGSVPVFGDDNDVAQVACTQITPGLPSVANYSGPVSVTATSKNGTDQISNVCLNGVCPVTAFGAVGDCTGSGSLTTCTDNTAAIQAAFTAGRSLGIPVYFPPNPANTVTKQTIYYVANAVNPLGVSMYGPAGMANTGNIFTNTPPTVGLRGGVGHDVFDEVDPTTPGWVAPKTAFAVRDLQVLVDNTIDNSASFPNRKPGRSCYDVTLTNGSAAISSPAQCMFQQGDVGQAIRVSDGTNVLTTTIASVTPRNQAKPLWVAGVTLAANWTFPTVSGTGTAYVSVDGLAATQTVGNCAFAYDAKDFTAGAYTTLITHRIEYTNVVINVPDNHPDKNYTCGYFFQGDYAPYFGLWDHNHIGADFGLVGAPSPNAAPSAGHWTGWGDFSHVKDTWFIGRYNWITYNGSFDNLEGIQLSDTLYGITILNAYGNETFASRWSIDIPEIESSTVTCPGSGSVPYRISGWSHDARRIETGTMCTPLNIWWEADDSTVQSWSSAAVNAFNLTGGLNKVAARLSSEYPGTSAILATGWGNTITSGFVGNPFDSIVPARTKVGGASAVNTGNPLTSRFGISMERTADFLKGNATTPYFNDEDLWLWPGEVGNNAGGHPNVFFDSTVESGAYFQVTTSTAQSLYESNGTQWAIGQQWPATKLRIYIKAKSETNPAAETVTLTKVGGGATYGTASLSWTTSYTTQFFDADLTGVAPGSITPLLTFANAAKNVDVAWIGIVTWNGGGQSLSVPVLFASLPACAAVTKGVSAKITDDATTCSFGTAATNGSGTGNYCPVGCDGTSWKAGY